MSTSVIIHKKHEISGLYILKFICAFLIVLIHVKSQASELLKPILRIAVPIFLIISGYFLVGANNKFDKSRISKNIKKIFYLIICTNAIYIIYWVLFSYINLDVLNDHFTLKRLIEFIFFGNVYCNALWYLTAYLEALLFILLLVRYKLESVLLIILPIGIILSILLGKYWIFFSDHNFIIHLSRNFFTIMLPCLTLGMLVRKNTNFFLKFAKPWIIGLFIIVLYLEEWTLMSIQPLNKGDIYIMTLPLAISVFSYFVQLKSKNRMSALLVKMGKNHTMNIFLYHILIADIVFLICGDVLDNYLAYIVFFIAIIISIFINKFT